MNCPDHTAEAPNRMQGTSACRGILSCVSRGPTRRVHRMMVDGEVPPALLRAAEHEADLLAHPYIGVEHVELARLRLAGRDTELGELRQRIPAGVRRRWWRPRGTPRYVDAASRRPKLPAGLPNAAPAGEQSVRRGPVGADVSVDRHRGDSARGSDLGHREPTGVIHQWQLLEACNLVSIGVC